MKGGCFSASSTKTKILISQTLTFKTGSMSYLVHLFSFYNSSWEKFLTKLQRTRCAHTTIFIWARNIINKEIVENRTGQGRSPDSEQIGKNQFVFLPASNKVPEENSGSFTHSCSIMYHILEKLVYKFPYIITMVDRFQVQVYAQQVPISQS